MILNSRIFMRRGSQVVRQGSAKASSSVRFRPTPFTSVLHSLGGAVFLCPELNLHGLSVLESIIVPWNINFNFPTIVFALYGKGNLRICLHTRSKFVLNRPQAPCKIWPIRRKANFVESMTKLVEWKVKLWQKV